VNGWILDLYPGDPGEMVVWLKQGTNRAARLVDRWTPSFYVACDSKDDLRALAREGWLASEAERLSFVARYAKVTDREMSEVLEVKVRDAKAMVRLASRVERSKPFGFYRIYNADVPPAQTYLYERDLFPLAYCKVSESGRGLEWRLQDDVWSCDYPPPPLSTASLRVKIDKEGALPRNSDPIKEIRIRAKGKERLIDSGPEGEKFREMVASLREADPDILFTNGGDSFLFSYLASRANEDGVYDELVLGRDGGRLELPSRAGSSFFSYGRIQYRPSTVWLRGRVHVDVANSFSVSEVGLYGFYELSRTCRMPLHTSSRASIGRALSSLQFYHAFKRGLLVPWKPTMAEHFKSRLELLVADRGGFIFEPRVGLYEGVAEFDFSALYPNIMLKKNISGETVNCDCCPDSKNRVPELGWNVCEKKVGVVPQAMGIVVGKRLQYKKLKAEARDKEERAKYDGRQMALKWIGVTSFGYLGFNNAKFGRIDAHIAVCAWDRKILLDSARAAEAKGFRVIHGIVDSLWVKKEGATEGDCLELREEIEKATGFDLSFEGMYKWIAFLPSKVNPSLPVANRYFGAYRNGELKVRGIEARRHDTPPLFVKCQMEMLEVLAKASGVEEARRMVPDCVSIFQRYARSIMKGEVEAEELIISRSLSKGPSEYTTDTLEASAATKLEEAGLELHPGQSVGYVIADYGSKGRKYRTIPAELLDARSRYDGRRYVELLAETSASVLQPFDPTIAARLNLSERANLVKLMGSKSS
jgi:DNA polymerase I